MTKEATARIKINKLLEAALRTKCGLDDASGAAISATLPSTCESAMGENHASRGGIDMRDSEAASAVMPPPNR